jgi:hypothetical protein
VRGYATDHALPSPDLDVRKLIGCGESEGGLDERIGIVACIQGDRGFDLVPHTEQIEAIRFQAALTARFCSNDNAIQLAM